MKRILAAIFLLSFIALASAEAQEVHYPQTVKALFDRADKEVSEYLCQGLVGKESRWFDSAHQPASAAGPRIAVPDCSKKAHLMEMVRMAGFKPVEMPEKNSCFADLWSEAAVGEVIKDEIEYRGISQKMLAAEIGVSYTQLNEVLNGKRPLNTEMAILISTALDLDAEPLLALQTRYDMITAQRDSSFIRRLTAVRKIASIL